MKFFLSQLKEQWGPLKYGPGYGHIFANKKYYLKRIIFSINDELVRLFINLKNNQLILIAVVVTITIALLVSTKVPQTAIEDILSTTSSAVFGCITLLVTAAIFMATLSNQAVTKSSDEISEFMTLLHKTEDIFKRAYRLSRDNTNADQKMRIVRAHAAESILDQNGYRKFKVWLKSIEDDFKGTVYENEIKYPYDIAYTASQYSRSWSIRDGIILLEDELLASVAIKHYILKAHRSSIVDLKAGISDYDRSAYANQYAQQPFLGLRLTRTVGYSLAALAMVYFYKITQAQQFNYFRSFDFHAVLLLEFAAIFSIILAVLLCLRYIIQLLSYFRLSAGYTAPLSTANIYSENDDHDPAKPYFHYGI